LGGVTSEQISSDYAPRTKIGITVGVSPSMIPSFVRTRLHAALDHALDHAFGEAKVALEENHARLTIVVPCKLEQPALSEQMDVAWPLVGPNPEPDILTIAK